MQWACGCLMQGSGGAVNPTGNTKRCEFAAMIMRFIEDIAAQQPPEQPLHPCHSHPFFLSSRRGGPPAVPGALRGTDLAGRGKLNGRGAEENRRRNPQSRRRDGARRGLTAPCLKP